MRSHDPESSMSVATVVIRNPSQPISLGMELLGGRVDGASLRDLQEEIEQLRAANEMLKQELSARHPFRTAQKSPVVGYTGCVICGAFTDHGGLPCPRLRPSSVSREGNANG